jgi:hypothetical protein
MEAGELEAVGGDPFEGGRLAGSAECAGRSEAGIVEEDDEDPVTKRAVGAARRGKFAVILASVVAPTC